jgi:glycosyltransferase involved in cell wall biosynthesis
MHKQCSGDIIVYMDDDDYYPPERVSTCSSSIK